MKSAYKVTACFTVLLMSFVLTSFFTGLAISYQELKRSALPFNNTVNCIYKNVTLSNDTLPLTGLVSFPGSGNTWVRHLIQQMTGIGTSSVYCDENLKKNGFPFECTEHKSRSVVTKTHLRKDVQRFKKIVLVVRNPYDAFLAFAQFASSGHTGTPSTKLIKKVMHSSFPTWSSNYKGLVKTVAAFSGPLFVLRYECLKSDMEAQLRLLASFLNASVTDEDITCTIRQQEGNHHRKLKESRRQELLHQVYNVDELKSLASLVRTTEDILKIKSKKQSSCHEHINTSDKQQYVFSYQTYVTCLCSLTL